MTGGDGVTLDGVLVVGAAVFYGGRLLVARRTRPNELAGKYELPGGKVEPGESLAQAAVRELQEELGLSIVVSDEVDGEFDLGHGLVMRVVCAALVPGASAEAVLGDTHDDVRWVSRDEALLMHRVDSVPWVPADMPAVAALANLVGSEWH